MPLCEFVLLQMRTCPTAPTLRIRACIASRGVYLDTVVTSSKQEDKGNLNVIMSTFQRLIHVPKESRHASAVRVYQQLTDQYIEYRTAITMTCTATHFKCMRPSTETAWWKPTPCLGCFLGQVLLHRLTSHASCQQQRKPANIGSVPDPVRSNSESTRRIALRDADQT
jgi:hypothetical protein